MAAVLAPQSIDALAEALAALVAGAWHRRAAAPSLHERRGMRIEQARDKVTTAALQATAVDEVDPGNETYPV